MNKEQLQEQISLVTSECSTLASAIFGEGQIQLMPELEKKQNQLLLLHVELSSLRVQ